MSSTKAMEIEVPSTGTKISRVRLYAVASVGLLLVAGGAIALGVLLSDDDDDGPSRVPPFCPSAFWGSLQAGGSVSSPSPQPSTGGPRSAPACYDLVTHVCDCSPAASQATCGGCFKTWTDECTGRCGDDVPTGLLEGVRRGPQRGQSAGPPRARSAVGHLVV